MRVTTYILFIVLCIYGCEEIGPDIILEEVEQPLVDTNYVIATIPVPQSKAVYIEEFSGVRCNNCPQGNQKIEDFIANFNNRIIPVTIHTPVLGQPYSGNENLNTSEGIQLADNLGPVNIKPSAFIDRTIFPSETNRLILLNTWDTHVNTQLGKTTPVNIELTQIAYDSETRVLRYKIVLTYTETSENQHIGILLTESDIVAAQLDGPDIIDDYVHHHVLRRFITPVQGLPIANDFDLIPGRVIEREFETTIDNNWDILHMYLVVFIRNSDQTVLHAAQLPLTL